LPSDNESGGWSLIFRRPITNSFCHSTEPDPAVLSLPTEKVTNVEDFIPDGGVIDSFLDHTKEVKDSGKNEEIQDSDR
jgi:hypothetical protein